MAKRNTDGTYWDCHDLLTRNALFSFAIGGRGTGKTYDAKYKRIRHYIKTGKRFIYLRRYKTEFDDRGKFFADIVDNFPDYEFDVRGMTGYIRRASSDEKNANKWEPLCYFVTLANALTKKSVAYPDVDMIIFDEFIIDKGHIHYMPNEVRQFLDFFNTVDRFEDRCRVLFLANAVTLTNPYFLYWKIRPRKDRRFYTVKGGSIVCEMVQSAKFQAKVDNTRFGRLIKGTAYYDYAVGNTFHDDNNRFISKKTEDAQFHYALRFDGRTVGVWIDYRTGIYYACAKIPKDAYIIVLTREDMEPNLLMIEKNNVLMKALRKLYMQGRLYFDTIETREFVHNILDYLGI